VIRGKKSIVLILRSRQGAFEASKVIVLRC